MNRLVLPLFFCLIAASSGFAGTIVQKKGAAILEVRFDGEEPSIALADLISVTLTIEGSPALQAPTAPLDLPATAKWKLEYRSKAVLDTTVPGKARWQLVYRFSPQEPGEKIPFHFPDVKYRDGEDEEQIASWNPISFKITTQIAPAIRAEPRDITAIETLPPLTLPAAWLWWLAGAAACLALVGAIVGVRVFLPRSSPRSPAQLARYEWQRLVAMKLPEKGRSERFITLLTLLVRRYVERQFALPARCLTTSEFMRILEQVTVLTAEQKQFLVRFLLRCEAVKFAQQPMPIAECDQWAHEVRDFLAAAA